MKKILFFLSAVLSFTILFAQTEFTIGVLTYRLLSENKVSVIACDTSATVVNVPANVSYEGVDYDVITIGDNAFQYRVNITSVHLPNGIVSIGNRAFYSCRNLSSVNLPDGLANIGNNAFNRCGALDSITIPSGVMSIGDYAFAGTEYSFLVSNPLFTTIVIPNTVNHIGKGAFAYCTNLVSVIFEEGSQLTSFVSTEDWEKTGTFTGCSALTYIQFPQNLNNIRRYTFDKCKSLANIDIPQSVSYIEEYAFSSCDALIDVDLSHIDSIAEYAFADCKLLTNVYLPNSAKIDSNAFANVGAKYIDGLTYSADLQLNVGDYTFNNIGGFTTFYIQTTPYSSVCEEFAVIDCDKSKGGEIVILDSIEHAGVKYPVTLIGINDNPIANCSYITSIVIGNNITNIKERAFNGCSSLKTVVIGEKVDSIGTEAFYFCNNLNSVTCLATTPPELGTTVFSYDVDSLFIPCGTYDSYMSTTWNYYWDPILYSIIIEASAITTTINATIEEGETYSEFGFNESQAGTYTQTFTAENGCDSIVTLNLYVNVSIDDTEFLKEISFYPNPTSGQITFNQAIETIEVINQLGNKEMKFTNTNTINIETLPKGVYFLRLEDRNAIVIRKFLKK